MSSSSEINVARVERLTYAADQVCAARPISKVTLWRLEERGLLRSWPQLRHQRYPTEAIRRCATPRQWEGR